MTFRPIVLCGPTASGKTELALELARQTNGLILSADSRQVYKHLTIGTAKPQGIWKDNIYQVENIPYYLVDFLEVTDIFNAGAFCVRAREITTKHPTQQLIFAGGTGMYVHAYFVGMDELPPSTPSSRKIIEDLLINNGKEGLHQILAQKDPISATQIPVGNVQRTMRALELCLLTNRPASELKTGRFFSLPDERKVHFVYLNWDKDILHMRIQKRTEQIFDGMVAEARTLLDNGFSPDTPALKSLGYPQAIEFLQGDLSRKEALDRVCTLTRQYAKRQRTWFNRYTNAQCFSLNATSDFNVSDLATQILQIHPKNPPQ